MKNIFFITILPALGMLIVFPGCPAAAAGADSLGAGARPDTVRSAGEVPGGKIPGGGAVKTQAEIKISREEREALKHTLQMMSRREVEGNRLWERHKSPKVAMYSNAILPGLGQVYNGRRIKTAIMVAAASYYIGNVWLNHKSAQRFMASRSKLPPDVKLHTVNFHNTWIQFYKEQSKDYLWWSGAVWILGLIDAWIDAHLYDIRAYTPPEVTGSATGATSAPYVTFTISF